MNRMKSLSSILTLPLVIFLMLFSVSSFAEMNDCWAEFYDQAQYKGDNFSLQGPAKLASLNSIKGENWDNKIDSIVVGPKAKVTVFEHRNFKLTLTEMAKYPELMHSLGITEQDIKEDSELIFHEGSRIHSLAEFNFHDKVRSIKIECVR